MSLCQFVLSCDPELSRKAAKARKSKNVKTDARRLPRGWKVEQRPPPSHHRGSSMDKNGRGTKQCNGGGPGDGERTSPNYRVWTSYMSFHWFCQFAYYHGPFMTSAGDESPDREPRGLTGQPTKPPSGDSTVLLMVLDYTSKSRDPRVFVVASAYHEINRLARLLAPEGSKRKAYIRGPDNKIHSVTELRSMLCPGLCYPLCLEIRHSSDIQWG